MKYAWLPVLLMMAAPWRANCSRIAIGYFYSDKVSIWRFWERGKDGQPEAKMLVYNVTDSAIKFSLKKCFHKAMPTKPVPRRSPGDSTYESQRGSDVNIHGASYVIEYGLTIVDEKKIPPHSYRVYKLVPSNSPIVYDAALVNGEFAGMCENLEEIQKRPSNHKYYSPEGLLGTPSRSYVISKDKLVGRGKRDEVHLYSKNTPEASRTIMTDNVTGVRAFSICFGNGTCHKRDGKSSSMNFSVEVDGASGAVIDLSCVVADKKKQAMLEIGEKIGNQSDGNSLLPVFVK